MASASADLYDPSTRTFTATGGVILIVGGVMQPTNAMGESGAELYDPTTGVFTMTGSLATGRYGAAASPLQ